MKKQINLILAMAIAIALSGAGFYGGTLYQKNQIGKARGNFANRPSDAKLGNGSTNGQNQQLVDGEITSQDDKSVTIKLRDSSSKIVLLSDSTTISKSTAGAKTDLAQGQQVMATGTKNSDGSITAQTIQIRPASN